VLLLGLDARPGESTGRSDALVVAHIDPERQTAALLSLPRDLWVAIPGIGEGKINGAYVQGGAQTAAATVGQALGVKIDHTVVIDFAGFRSLIDALGGITVDVPRELYDSKFPTDDYGIVEAHFLPGPQLMDGKQALTYSRIRHPDSDFARMRRQQAVLIGISAKLRKLGAFQSLHEADRLTGALVPYVRTSLGRGTAAQLLWSLRGLDPAGVGRLILDGGMLQETTIGGSYALVADSGTLHSLGAQLTAP
jgi:LCP family protein required for cell wall assembly